MSQTGAVQKYRYDTIFNLRRFLPDYPKGTIPDSTFVTILGVKIKIPFK